jgi:peptidyl-dipeptidase A
MKEDYARFAGMSNLGRNGSGFPDSGALWRPKYDMPMDEYAKE